MASSPSIRRVGQIAVVIHDLERAIAFYRDVLGLKMLFRAGELAFFDGGNVRLMLSRPEKPEFDHPGSILYFAVDDIQAAHRAMRSAGAQFRGDPHMVARMPDHELWMAFFQDSENNILALMSEVRS